MLRLWSLTAALMLAGAPLCLAQTGVIEGMVREAVTERPLRGSHVALIGADRGTVADSLGRFRMDDVPAGQHRVRASFVGYESQTRQIELVPGDTLVLIFELEDFLRNVVLHPHILVQADRIRTVGRTRDTPRLIPQAVTVLDEAQLDAQGVVDVESALRNVSGVAVEGREQPFATFTIRGLSADPTGTFRRNGIEYPHLFGRLRPNVTQVEVLKGPASVLYGRLEPGGVVNFVTRRPGCSEADYRASVSGDNLQTFGGSGIVETGCHFWRDPTVVVDAAAERRGSFRDHVSEESAYASAAARIYPFGGEIRIDLGIEINPDLDAEVEWAGAILDPGLAVPGAMIPGGLDRHTFFGEQAARYRWQNAFASATAEWLPDIAWQDGVAVRSVTARLAYGRYRHGRDRVALDSLTTDGLVARSLRADDNRYRYLYGEVSADGDWEVGPVSNRFTTGLEATRLGIDFLGEAPLSSSNGGFRFAAIESVSLTSPASTGLPGEGDLVEYASASGSGWNVGLFAQNRATLSTPAGPLHAVGSLRLSRVSAGAEWFALAETPESPAGLNERHVTMAALTPAVALLLAPTSQLSFYGSYGTSFNPIFQQVDAEGRPFEPTRGEQFETGMKVEARRVMATLAAFDVRKRGALSLTPGGHYVQTGLQRSRGLEVDVSASPLPRLTLLGAFTLLDARVVEDAVIPEGNRLPAAPTHSARVWAGFDVLREGPRLTLAIGYQFVGERFGTLENDLLLPAHGLVDASVRLRTGIADLLVSVENLLDRQYLVSGELRGTGASPLVVGWPGSPRTVALRLRLDL